MLLLPPDRLLATFVRQKRFLELGQDRIGDMDVPQDLPEAIPQLFITNVVKFALSPELRTVVIRVSSLFELGSHLTVVIGAGEQSPIRKIMRPVSRFIAPTENILRPFKQIRRDKLSMGSPIEFMFPIELAHVEGILEQPVQALLEGGYAMRNVLRICALLLLVFSAQTVWASEVTYDVILNGPSESPANASPGIGFAVVTIDSTTNILNIVSFTFSGLAGTTTASHIHCCTALPGTGTARVATQVPYFSGFPIGVTSGSYSMSFDMTQASTWNPAFITASGGTTAGAEAALAAGAAAGEAYLNIHSTFVPGGEIRGFLVATPEPGTLLLLGTGLLGLAGAACRKWLG